MKKYEKIPRREMDKGDDCDPIESVKVLEILEPSFPLSTTV